MHLTHLGLPVREATRSVAFYSAYFGFDPATAQTYQDGTHAGSHLYADYGRQQTFATPG